MNQLNIFACLCVLFMACQNNNANQLNENEFKTTAIENLLSDTFQDNAKPLAYNSDSVKEALFQNLNIKTIQDIESFDAIKLSKSYDQLFKLLKKSDDSSRSERNQILYAIFEKLNSKQVMLEDSQAFEIKNKLQIAQLKSQIRPYFKK
jgi:hypothetical protein